MVHVPMHLIHSDENIKLFLDTHASPLYWNSEQLESDPEPDLDNPKKINIYQTVNMKMKNVLKLVR